MKKLVLFQQIHANLKHPMKMKQQQQHDVDGAICSHMLPIVDDRVRLESSLGSCIMLHLIRVDGKVLMGICYLLLQWVETIFIS